MSARNSGLSACRSALRASSDSWLTRFLMSWRMKAKRRLNSSNRCASASASWPIASASELAAWLPAVRSRSKSSQSSCAPVFGRREDHEPDQPLLVEQRNAGPDRTVLEQPLRHGERLVSRARPAAAKPLELDDPAALLDLAPEAPAIGQAASRTEFRPASHQLAATVTDPPAIADQKEPARRVDDVGEGLDDALAERAVLGGGAPDRLGEAKPLGAIIVAVLEQMLGELDLDPAARPGARESDHRRDGHDREHPTISAADQSMPDAAKRGGDDRHQREISADREQRERLEGRRARQPDPPPALVAGRQREHRRGQRDGEPAPLDHRAARSPSQIGDRVEIEVVEPDQREPERRKADVRPARRRRLAVDVVNQDERAGGGGDPKHQPGLRKRAARRNQLERRADELQPDDRGDRAIDELQPVLALLARCGEAVEQADPEEVAGAFGIADDRVARRRPRRARPSRR